MSDKKVFKYIDLFSGIGGFRKALDFLSKDLDIKTKCVAFSEIDKYATLSYKANYDTENEVDYINHGGILPYVIRQLINR